MRINIEMPEDIDILEIRADNSTKKVYIKAIKRTGSTSYLVKEVEGSYLLMMDANDSLDTYLKKALSFEPQASKAEAPDKDIKLPCSFEDLPDDIKILAERELEAYVEKWIVGLKGDWERASAINHLKSPLTSRYTKDEDGLWVRSFRDINGVYSYFPLKKSDRRGY